MVITAYNHERVRWSCGQQLNIKFPFSNICDVSDVHFPVLNVDHFSLFLGNYFTPSVLMRPTGREECMEEGAAACI